MNCSTCGAKMAHFKNPDRDICPNEPHTAQVQSGTKGMKPGQQAGGRKTDPDSKNQQRVKAKEEKDKKKR